MRHHLIAIGTAHLDRWITHFAPHPLRRPSRQNCSAPLIIASGQPDAERSAQPTITSTELLRIAMTIPSRSSWQRPHRQYFEVDPQTDTVRCPRGSAPGTHLARLQQHDARCTAGECRTVLIDRPSACSQTCRSGIADMSRAGRRRRAPGRRSRPKGERLAGYLFPGSSSTGRRRTVISVVLAGRRQKYSAPTTELSSASSFAFDHRFMIPPEMSCPKSWRSPHGYLCFRDPGSPRWWRPFVLGRTFPCPGPLSSVPAGSDTYQEG